MLKAEHAIMRGASWKEMPPRRLEERDMSRPGWPEIMIGLVVMAIVGYGGGSQLVRLGLDPLTYGLLFSALSGVSCLAGFAAAVSLRIRSLAAFGVRRTSVRWLWIGAALGLGVFVAKGFATIAFVRIFGDMADVQQVYAAGGGGLMSIVLATFFMAVVTPICEEFLFRGVVAHALLRYGPVIGVLGSTSIFAAMHGINMAFPAAVVAGLATGEIFRRSGSIWPGVIVHVVCNLPTIPAMVFINAAR